MNAFPLAFNTAFEADDRLLPDRSALSSWPSRFEFFPASEDGRLR